MSEQHRQGDFIFIRVDSIPEGAVAEERVNGRAIVGLGEATGHHHSFRTPESTIRTLENIRWIEAPVVTPVEHQEHDVIQLPPGLWIVRKERTWNAGHIQRVVD